MLQSRRWGRRCSAREHVHPATLLAVPCQSRFDFHTLTPEQLHVIELPLHCELQVVQVLLLLLLLVLDPTAP